MSKDIRSFFQIKKPQKPVIEDDDDVIPESPDVAINIKKKESRKKRIICEDSDDDTFVSKKIKPSSSDKKTGCKKSLKHTKSPNKSSLKEVKAADIFGSSKIKRTEPIVKKEKKKTEIGIHSDDEFDKSLLELDEIEDTSPKKNEPIPESSKLDKHHNSNEKSKQKNDDIKEKTNSQNNTSESQNKHESIKPLAQKQTQSDNKTDKLNQSKSKLEQKRELLQKHKSRSEDKNERKRDFSEFMENDTSTTEEEPPKTRRKHNKSLNESVLTDEERHERKMHSAALYKNYLNRSGPKHLGAKEIPNGSPNCLNDCAFLLTGVLESFEREEIADAIAKFGGTVKNSISKKVTHVLAGEDAGPAKMAKAEELGIKIINEDQFLQLIKDQSKSNKDDRNQETKKIKEESKIKKEKVSPQEKTKINGISKDAKVKQELSDNKSTSVITESNSSHNTKITKSKSPDNEKVISVKKEINNVDREKASSKSVEETQNVETVKRENSASAQAALLWVDKYKPQSVKQIIGQHGDASNVKRLTKWLTKWYVNRKAKLPKPSPWAKNDDGGYYKAALLSGPPGVGKTTTVSLVCRELGFDVVELNASDSRNKSLMKEQIGELLTTTSLSRYAKGETGKQAVSKKHVLVMDEVDGMAGNEDRGGLQELIALIKSSSVPIICTCNDRNSQKMRSLVNYCYDLRFSRPRVDQIKSAMMSICFKEGIKIPADTLSQLITSANQDVRQTLNLLSMWAIEPKLASAEKLKDDVKTVRKDIKLGPWEAVRKVFSHEDHKTMSLIDKSDLFFYDYSLAPLFVQENYLQVKPHCPDKEVLHRISKAADSISIGDMVEAKIRRSQAWSLLPMQAMYSSVIPGTELSGHVAGQIQFPAWLGKNSKANKMHRMCQEIHAHTRLSTSGSKSSIYLDYSPHLRDAILTPLVKDHSEGIDRALDTLEAYHLLREDLDSLVELSLWPGQRNPMLLIDSKVKAAMTRTYNKKASTLPYAPGAIRRVKRDDNEEYQAEEENGDADEELDQDSDPENDALIKKKKAKDTEKPNSKKASTSREKPSSSKKKK